jgi:hypothetical protein
MRIIKNKLIKISSKTLLSTVFLLLITFSVPASAAAAANPDCNKKNPTSTQLQNCLKNNVIYKDINKIIDFMAAGVGIIVIGSIIYGGIQYAIAGNNANTVSAAKKRITDSLIALIAFFFIFAFLEWLVPGGIIS